MMTWLCWFWHDWTIATLTDFTLNATGQPYQTVCERCGKTKVWRRGR